MAPYRLPSSLIVYVPSGLVAETAAAEARRRAAVRSFWWKRARAAAYLVGGLVALLLANSPFVWTPAMTAGAFASGSVAFLWIVWVGLLTGGGAGAIVGVNVLGFLVHVGVVVWGWTAYGPATAVPWLFVQMGALGLVGGLVLLACLPVGLMR